jgi:mono/diheme cytochrome c family protein
MHGARIGLCALAAVLSLGYSQALRESPLELKLGAPAPAWLGKPEAGKMTVLLISSSAPCASEQTRLNLDKRGAALRCVVEKTPAMSGAVILLDAAGVVRAVAPARTDPAALFERWRMGKALFEQACARCHTEDGADEFYSYNIKRLRGIGNRLSHAEILERTNPVPMGPNQFSIRAFLYSKEELDALITYVAGL